MAAASPSEFLTFFRRMSTSQSLRYRSVSRGIITRPFSSTIAPSAQPDHKDGKHLLDKRDEPMTQAYESNQGIKNRQQGTGGSATEQRDSNSSTEKAKKEFPEAPDTVIGMQDERGGKGH